MRDCPPPGVSWIVMIYQQGARQGMGGGAHSIHDFVAGEEVGYGRETI